MENVFLTDVLNQPEAMANAMAVYENYGPQMAQIAALHPRQVLFTGMGSSHWCSQGAVIALNRGGIPARMESASEILHYEGDAITSDTLLVLTSQSGESGEIVDILKNLPREQTVIGITNNPDSSLGRRADICLQMRVAPELAVSTRTYLASLVLSDMVAAALLGEDFRNSLAQFSAAADVLADYLKNHNRMQEQIMGLFGCPSSVCYIGRGFGRATAECGGLFTRETAKYPALSFDSGEFRHGPFEMVDDTFCCMVFAPEGVGLQMQKNLTEAIASHGGRVVFVTDSDAAFDSDRVLVLRHGNLNERYAPLVQIAAPQLFANAMAIHRGFAPGVFRQSSKITTVQ